MPSPEATSGVLRWPPLVAPAAAAALGIVVDRQWPLAAVIWWLLAASTALLWWLAFRRRNRSAAMLLLLVSTAFAAAAWGHDRWHRFPENEIGRFTSLEPQPAAMRVTALSEPIWVPAPPPSALRTGPQGDESELQVRLTHLRQGTKWHTVSGEAKLTVQGHLLGVRAGDQLLAFVDLVEPSPPMNPGGFDYAAWLRKDRELAELRAGFPDCVRVVSPAAHRPASTMARVRSRGNAALWKHIGEERGALAATLLLNDREQLDRRRRDSFFHTGTIHLLAISGMHVAILVGFATLLLKRVAAGRRISLLIAAAIAIGYALLTDAQPPVLRSAVLFSILCAGDWMGKRPLNFNTLALAAIVVMLLNPAELFQVGAQLSFLAVATLSAFSRASRHLEPQDPLDRLIAASRPRPLQWSLQGAHWFYKLWLTGLFVWLVTLPLILYEFHLASPVALILNPLLWIPIAVAMIAGFGVLAFSWLVPPLAGACGAVCNASLAIVETMIDWFERFPGGWFWTSGPPLWWVGVFYLGLAAHWAFPTRRSKATPPETEADSQFWLKNRYRFAAALLWISFGFIVSAASGDDFPGREHSLQCTFLSVGHGTSVVIETPDGKTILYDAGRLGSPTPAARGIAGFLWTRGISHLDAVVLSHADADHYNALPELLEFVSVGVVYVSPMMFEGTNAEAPGLVELRRAIEGEGIPLREIWSGDKLSSRGDLHIEVMHPPRRGVLALDEARRDNANSLVLLLECFGRRVLLPGDLEPPGLEDVLAESPLDCDVVMAPHHGSRNSLPHEVAAWATPKFVVVSAGESLDVGPARQAFLSAGASVFHTAHHGAVSFTIDREGIEARAFRPSSR